MSQTQPAGEYFDYIVVGAGSAGCAAAARLSETGASVLLLEAGPVDKNIWIHVPLGYGKTMFNPALNWMFETQSNPHLNGRKVKQPRGKMLGGSSSLNGLLYVRGQHQDYDDWVNLGCPGWGWRDVLPVFKRSEDQQRGSDEWHGAGGPLSVTDFPDGTHPLAELFFSAAESLGYPRNADFNGATQEGLGYYQATARNGLRCSSAAAFLRPNRQRSNLVVRTDAQVIRLIFHDRTAKGVEYRQGGENRNVLARREIILSAGAIQSPQILELSGVGNPELLGPLGIPIVHALPSVGEHFHDHLQSRLIYRVLKPITINDILQSLPRQAAMVLQYLLARRGPLTWLAAIAGGFLKTNPALDRPDIQIQLYPYSSDRVDPSLHPFSAFTVTICKLRPSSRGSVHIHSPDPFSPPAIQPGYLNDPADLATHMAAIKLAREIVAQPAMRPLVGSEYDPGAGCVTDADLEEFIRAKAFSVYHPVGSVRMGEAADCPLDSRLRVKGISGLRVADASVMPMICSGNTNAAAIMIGERAADFIKEDSR